MARKNKKRIPHPEAVKRMEQALNKIDLVAMARRVEWSLYKSDMWRRGYRYDEKLEKFVLRRTRRRQMPNFILRSAQPTTERNRMSPKKETVCIVLPAKPRAVVVRRGQRFNVMGHHYRLATSPTGGVAVVKTEILTHT